MYNINIPYIYIYTYIHNTAYFHISSTGNLPFNINSFSQVIVSSNTGTSDLVTWSSKRKLVG